jgi:hypothetical protein
MLLTHVPSVYKLPRDFLYVLVRGSQGSIPSAGSETAPCLALIEPIRNAPARRSRSSSPTRSVAPTARCRTAGYRATSRSSRSGAMRASRGRRCSSSSLVELPDVESPQHPRGLCLRGAIRGMRLDISLAPRCDGERCAATTSSGTRTATASQAQGQGRSRPTDARLCRATEGRQRRRMADLHPQRPRASAPNHLSLEVAESQRSGSGSFVVFSKKPADEFLSRGVYNAVAS